MRLPYLTQLLLLSTPYILSTATTASPVSQAPLLLTGKHHISESLFADLEELSRLVDISYCVGTTGIRKPFACAHRCKDFRGFELVTVGTSIYVVDHRRPLESLPIYPLYLSLRPPKRGKEHG